MNLHPSIELITAVDATDQGLFRAMKDPTGRGPLLVSPRRHRPPFTTSFVHDPLKINLSPGLGIKPDQRYDRSSRQEEPVRALRAYYTERLRDAHSKSTVVLINLPQLAELKRLFPQVTINQYEMFDSFWKPSEQFFFGDQLHSRPRRHYDQYLMLCNDDELWLHPSGPLLARSDPVTVDCIMVSGEFQTPLPELALRLWEKAANGEEARTGQPTHNPTFLISSIPDTARFPLQKRSTEEELEIANSTAEYYQQVGAFLMEHAGGCGWFTGTFQIKVLAFQDPGDGPNLLVRPGTEHEHVLPMSNEQLLQRIDRGDMESRKLCVWDSKGNNYARFREGLEQKMPWPDPWTYEERLDKTLCRPETEEVVFYCNRCSSSSPAAAEGYLQWLKDKRPDRRQKVYVLENGMGGLLDHLKTIGKVDQYLTVHSYYYS